MHQCNKKSPHLTSVIYENCPDVRYMDQFLEHPLSCSRKYMDLAPKSGVLAHLDSVELWCLGKKKQTGSETLETLPNREP